MSERIPLNVGVCACIQGCNYCEMLNNRIITIDSFAEGNYLLNPVKFAIRTHRIPEGDHREVTDNRCLVFVDIHPYEGRDYQLIVLLNAFPVSAPYLYHRFSVAGKEDYGYIKRWRVQEIPIVDALLDFIMLPFRDFTQQEFCFWLSITSPAEAPSLLL